MKNHRKCFDDLIEVGNAQKINLDECVGQCPLRSATSTSEMVGFSEVCHYCKLIHE